MAYAFLKPELLVNTHMFSVFFGLVAQLDEVIQLVEQLLARAVDLSVGLTHVLVE